MHCRESLYYITSHWKTLKTLIVLDVSINDLRYEQTKLESIAWLNFDQEFMTKNTKSWKSLHMIQSIASHLADKRPGTNGSNKHAYQQTEIRKSIKLS